MQEVTRDDLEWWLAKAQEVEWIWAKTFANSAPHWYVVLGRTRGMTKDEFTRAGKVIQRFGTPGKFYRKTNIYLTDGTWRYWLMPEFDKGIAYNATLINRAPVGDLYGVQNAPRTESGHTSVYDSVASDYDATWITERDLAENAAVRKLIVGELDGMAPVTLDIGCGTGLLLDLKLTNPQIYVGVDPSQGMLNYLVSKHPKVTQVYPMTFEEYLEQKNPGPGSFELVTALFAATSYLQPWAIERAAALASRLAVFMNYDGKWLPDYYDEETPAPTTIDAARETTRALVDRHPGYNTVIGNFEVTVLTP